jgi:lipid-binding SYLF domain-containing protein
LATRLIVVAHILAAVIGCATQSPGKGKPTAAELDAMGDKAVAILLETRPETREVIDRSVGYVVLTLTATKIPFFGTASGYGVVVDKRINTRTYVKVSRFEIGGGLGRQTFKVIIALEDEKRLNRIASGTWNFEAGADVASGTSSAEGTATKSGKGYRAFKLAEGGAAATVTVRVAYAKPYLTE